MKHRHLILLLAVAMLLPAGCARTGAGSGGSAAVSASSAPESPPATATVMAQAPAPEAPDVYVYLGVEGYGSVNKDAKPDFRYRFFVDGEEISLAMDNGAQDPEGGYAYPLQNRLKEGSLYTLQKEGDTVTDLREVREGDPGIAMGTVEAVAKNKLTVNGTKVQLKKDTGIWDVSPAAGGAQVQEAALSKGDRAVVLLRKKKAAAVYRIPRVNPYTPPVSGTPGQRTLRNFLATALMPVGTTLYIYGGGWDWQDVGSSPQATSIGVSPDWVRFFQGQDESYTYKNPDPAKSFYPCGEWNEYYYAGLDCSGYLGWVLYNTRYAESGQEGYVGGSTKFASRLAGLGWGTLTGASPEAMAPGDIVSIKGHVWISLGHCSDGSVLILHSTPTDSRAGQPGGGPQLGAIGGSENCEAYQLADRYMATCYPDWYKRYPVSLKESSVYFNGASRFTWDVSGANDGLTDPEGCQNMTPAELLETLFAGAEKAN